jgi:hypothetical protein
VCIFLRITLVTPRSSPQMQIADQWHFSTEDPAGTKSKLQCLERNGLVASPLKLLQCVGGTRDGCARG